jgi:hypothetical protein
MSRVAGQGCGLACYKCPEMLQNVVVRVVLGTLCISGGDRGMCVVYDIYHCITSTRSWSGVKSEHPMQTTGQ